MLKWIFYVRLRRNYLRGPMKDAFYYASGKTHEFPHSVSYTCKGAQKVVIMLPAEKELGVD